jgi:nitroimidazol reductase NimA-like FMN-containing flavoprotein (pyridoxamine 5'-phosphate oxidase superfamily)
MRRNDREVTGTGEVEEIIRKADVCRIALADDNMPYLVTLNFGYSASPLRTFFFHCANEGKKLDIIRKNNNVCFELDTDHQLITGPNSCDWGMKYSSIIGYGKIFIITEKEEKKLGLNHIMEHYGAGGEFSYNESILQHTTVLRLEVEQMTGKKKK